MGGGRDSGRHGEKEHCLYVFMPLVSRVNYSYLCSSTLKGHKM